MALKLHFLAFIFDYWLFGVCFVSKGDIDTLFVVYLDSHNVQYACIPSIDLWLLQVFVSYRRL